MVKFLKIITVNNPMLVLHRVHKVRGAVTIGLGLGTFGIPFLGYANAAALTTVILGCTCVQFGVINVWRRRELTVASILAAEMRDDVTDKFNGIHARTLLSAVAPLIMAMQLIVVGYLNDVNQVNQVIVGVLTVPMIFINLFLSVTGGDVYE